MVLKRLMAPKFWPIEVKTKKFVVEPIPGPHSKRTCMPLALLLRDELHYARNMKEVESMLRQGIVKVDGVVRKEHGFGVGLMDVVSVGNEHYRMIPIKYGLRMHKIENKESGIKLLRLENKTIVKKRKVQLNFHDGKNLLVEENDYKTGDVVIFDFNENKIKDVIKFEKESSIVVIQGNNVGSTGTIEEIIVTKSSMENQIVVNLGKRKITLPKSYVFAIGKDTHFISLQQ